MTTWRARWWMIGLMSLTIGVYAQGQTNGQKLYRLGANESLATVAERHLGGEEYARELLEFNKIENPTMVGEGTLIAIPGVIRDEAYAALKMAEVAVQRAREAMAERYAASTFSSAENRYKLSREQLFRANYAKSIGHSQLAETLAREAEREANANANVTKDGRVALVHGQVEISEDEGATWRPVKAGDPLPIRAIVRTGGAARAEVILEDGSRLQVTEGTELRIDQYIEDLRNGRLDIELDVRIGNVLGRIKPKSEGSRMNIKSGKAAIAIRGTILRTRTDPEQTTYTEVLEGAVDLVVPRKRPVQVEEHFGVVAKRGKTPSAPIALLPAPVVGDASAGPRTTAVQRVRLHWAPIESRRLGNYQVEIAQDPEFLTIEQNLFTVGESVEAEVLREGDYYWRVTAIDDRGLVGMPGDAQSLIIRKDLSAAMMFRGTLVKSGERQVGGPSNEYSLLPGNTDTSIVGTQVSVNDSPFRTMDEGLRLTQDGEYTIRMRGMGIEGDAGPVQELAVRVDGTPPEVTLKVGSPVLRDDGTHIVEASLRADDETGVDRIEIAVDDADFRTYQQPFPLSAYRDYRVRFRAIDVLGNPSSEYEVRVAGEWVPRDVESGVRPISR